MQEWQLHLLYPTQDIQIRFNLAKYTIPEYSGGSKDLLYFLTQAEKLKDNFTFTDEVLNNCFSN